MKANLAKAVAAAILANVPLAAGASQLSTWVERFNNRLEQAMPDDSAVGAIAVTFHRGPDGRAADVRAVDGNAALERSARQTLAAMGVLPALPAGYDPSTQIKMQLFFHGHDTFDLLAGRAMTQDVRRARADAAARNAELALRHEDSDQLALANPR